MCLAVYIASDRELPLIPWNKDKPSFHVRDLSYDSRVAKQFSLPNIRYVGSSEGCGCGFLKDGVVGEELVLTEQNYASLAAYVSKKLADGAQIQLFACWAGGQKSFAEANELIMVEDLCAKDFEFKEKYFYEVVTAK